MAKQSSFDIVSKVDIQEIDNAVNQAIKEMSNRYDFKGSKSEIKFLKEKVMIQLIGDDDMKLRNLQDILKTRVSARSIPLKSLDFKEPEKAFEGTLRQQVHIVQGLPQDKAKEIVKLIKESRLKVQAAINGDIVRVTSKSKDDLQEVMSVLQSKPLTVAIQFENYR